MFDELLFNLLQYSSQDWVNFHAISNRQVDEFTHWIWVETESYNNEQPEEWLNEKIIEFKKTH